MRWATPRRRSAAACTSPKAMAGSAAGLELLGQRHLAEPPGETRDQSRVARAAGGRATPSWTDVEEAAADGLDREAERAGQAEGVPVEMAADGAFVQRREETLHRGQRPGVERARARGARCGRPGGRRGPAPATPAPGPGIVQSASEMATVSNAASGNGSASASACTNADGNAEPSWPAPAPGRAFPPRDPRRRRA